MIDTLDIFASEVKRIDKETQGFVTELRKRMKDVERSMGDDWEKPEYAKGLKQFAFLQKCIDTIVVQQNLSVQFTDIIWKEAAWGLDKETELAQVKLELSRMKQNNALLIKMCTKLDGHKIVNNFPE